MHIYSFYVCVHILCRENETFMTSANDGMKILSLKASFMVNLVPYCHIDSNFAKMFILL